MASRRVTLRLHILTIIATFFALSVAMAGEAAAACFIPRPTGRPGAPAAGRIASSVVKPGVARDLAAAALQGDNSGSGPLVGMWRSVFTAFPGTSDEFVFDEGFQQFHADGNELMISRGVPPDLGNVCIGVWKHTAAGVIKLRHVTWNWGGQAVFNSGEPFADAFTNANTGSFEIVVTLRVSSRGTRFSGTWEATSFDVNGVPVPDSQFSGTVQSERIDVD